MFKVKVAEPFELVQAVLPVTVAVRITGALEISAGLGL